MSCAYVSSLNHLFSSSSLDCMVRGEESRALRKAYDVCFPDGECRSRGDVVEESFRLMGRGYRNEYFFENTLVNKLLLGRYGLSSATALSQVPVGNCIADLVIINGKAVVYEIKSPLDNFERLANQLSNYYKAFTEVCLVVSEEQYAKACSVIGDGPVGLCVVTRRGTVSNVFGRKPGMVVECLEHKAVFQLLRKAEYEDVIRGWFGSLPETTPVTHYRECFKWFCSIPVVEAQRLAVAKLKQRKSHAQKRVADVPYSLRSLVYFSKMKDRDYDALAGFLSGRMEGLG